MGRLKQPAAMNSEGQLLAQQNANQDEASSMTLSQDDDFWAAINAVPVTVWDSSSSEDDLSSLGDWREISKRLDSDFESDEEELSTVQSSPPEASTSHNSTSATVRAFKPKLKGPPKPKKAKTEPVHREAPKQTFACTYANCNRRYTTRWSFKSHLDDHRNTKRMYLCLVCSLRFLRMQDLSSHLKFNHLKNQS